MKNLTKNKSQYITLFAMLFIAFTTTLTSCKKDCIKSYGNEITKELKVNSLDKIANRMAADIIITEGTTQKIVVTGPENIIKNLTNDVIDGEYQIALKPGIFLCADYDLIFNITIPKIKEVIISGAGDITINDFNQTDDFKGLISGAGSIELNKFDNVESMNLKISGSGKIIALQAFTIKDLTAKISGSGSIKGYLLESENSTVVLSGAGSCYVNAQKTLDAKLSGSGNIFYKGNPSITSKITGAGSIKNKN